MLPLLDLAFSLCQNEAKNLKVLDGILVDSTCLNPLSFTYGSCYQSLNMKLKCESRKTKFSSINNPLLQNLRHLLDDLENKRECTFDEVEWSKIKKNIIRLNGERVTKEDQPDIFIIPNLLTQEQCEEVVKIHRDISNSVSTKLVHFNFYLI